MLKGTKHLQAPIQSKDFRRPEHLFSLFPAKGMRQLSAAKPPRAAPWTVHGPFSLFSTRRKRPPPEPGEADPVGRGGRNGAKLSLFTAEAKRAEFLPTIWGVHQGPALERAGTRPPRRQPRQKASGPSTGLRFARPRPQGAPTPQSPVRGQGPSRLPESTKRPCQGSPNNSRHSRMAVVFFSRLC